MENGPEARGNLRVTKNRGRKNNLRRALPWIAIGTVAAVELSYPVYKTMEMWRETKAIPANTPTMRMDVLGSTGVTNGDGRNNFEVGQTELLKERGETRANQQGLKADLQGLVGTMARGLEDSKANFYALDQASKNLEKATRDLNIATNALGAEVERLGTIPEEKSISPLSPAKP